MLLLLLTSTITTRASQFHKFFWLLFVLICFPIQNSLCLENGPGLNDDESTVITSNQPINNPYNLSKNAKIIIFIEQQQPPSQAARRIAPRRHGQSAFTLPTKEVFTRKIANETPAKFANNSNIPFIFQKFKNKVNFAGISLKAILLSKFLQQQ